MTSNTMSSTPTDGINYKKPTSKIIALHVPLYATSAYPTACPTACLVASLVVIGVALLDLGFRLIIATTSLHKHKYTNTHATTPVS